MEPISVSERLPEMTHKRGYCEFSDRVLVWSTQFGEWITGRYERDSGWKDDNEYCCEIEHVTHYHSRRRLSCRKMALRALQGVCRE